MTEPLSSHEQRRLAAQKWPKITYLVAQMNPTFEQATALGLAAADFPPFFAFKSVQLTVSVAKTGDVTVLAVDGQALAPLTSTTTTTQTTTETPKT